MKNNLRYDPMDQSSEGLIWGAVSGLITGIAAGGDVAGLRNIHATPIVVQRIRIRFVPTTAFASAQAMAFRVNKVTGFTAIHTTGGTAVQAHYNYGEGINVNRAGAALATGDRIPLAEISGYIAATGAISGATYTAEDTDEPDVFAIGSGSALPSVWENWTPPGGPMVLPQNTGLVVNNHIAMGGSGVGNLFVAVDGFRLG